MQAHGNTTQVVLELWTLLIGLPLLGLLLSVFLWFKANQESDPNRRQYLRIGFAAVSVAFLAPLCADCIRSPASALTRILGTSLPLLCLAGVLASLTAVVLLAVNGCGFKRVGGAVLGLLGFVYCGLTLLAYGGGGGY